MVARPHARARERTRLNQLGERVKKEELVLVVVVDTLKGVCVFTP